MQYLSRIYCVRCIHVKQAFGDNNFLGNKLQGSSTHTDLALDEVNYGGVQLGRSHEVSLPQIQWNWCVFFWGGIDFIHFGWDDFSPLCLCVCVSRVCLTISAPHITRSVTWNLRFHTSGNSNWRQVAILHLLESYPTESLINSQATLRGLQLQMLQCWSPSCRYIELGVWSEESATNCSESDLFASFLERNLWPRRYHDLRMAGLDVVEEILKVPIHWFI